MNDRPCRLRDIQDLFSGTGLSGGHYAIIEQGRIGQILSAKPMDRRTIIEEAAGITKFRVRQRAAEARLESARGNLSRVSDIISEIERQVNSLRRQAAKARRYRILREELRELLRRVYVGEEQSLTALLEQSQAELDLATKDEERLATALAEREEASHAATLTARTLEDELAQVRAAVAEAALQRDRRIRERVYQEEQVETLSRRRTELERELTALNSRLVIIESELERLRQLDSTLTAENEQTTAVLRSAEETHAQKLAEIAAGETEIEAARAELMNHTVAAERLLELTRQLETRWKNWPSRPKGWPVKASARPQRMPNETPKPKGLLRQSSPREKSLRVWLPNASAPSKRWSKVTNAFQTPTPNRRGCATITRACWHRLDSFKELDQRRAHYSLAVQEAFSANEAEDFHLIGTLADAIQVDA